MARRETFKIKHPDHGIAQCSEEQFDEFASLGWERAEDAPAKRGPGRPKKADAAPAE